MKRFFLLIFVLFCGLIFYQFVLGKNGIIEGYRIKKEKEKFSKLHELLTKEFKNNSEYIEYLKNDPDSLMIYANRLGFFTKNNEFIKIINETNDNSCDYVNLNNGLKNEINKIYYEIKNVNEEEQKINKIKKWMQIFFYIFFGFFIILTIFGIRKKDVKNT